jgi:hypothetical protein
VSAVNIGPIHKKDVMKASIMHQFKSEYATIIADHKKWLPQVDLPPAPNSASRVLTYDAKTDEAIWEGKTVKRGDAIPE